MGWTNALARQSLAVESLADYLAAPAGSWRHDAAQLWHREWAGMGMDAKSLALALEDASGEIDAACLVLYSDSGYGGDVRQVAGEPKIFPKGRRPMNAQDWDKAACLAQGCAGCARLIVSCAERLNLDKSARLPGQQAPARRI